jgi:hypothetical protein
MPLIPNNPDNPLVPAFSQQTVRTTEQRIEDLETMLSDYLSNGICADPSIDQTVNNNLNLAGLAMRSLSGPTVTVTPTGGSATSYTYAVVARMGPTLKSAAASGSTAAGAATLTSSAYNTVTWTAVTGATSYDVYRTVGGTNQGKIATATTALSVTDNGISADGSTAPVIASVGSITLGTLFYESYTDTITAHAGGGQTSATQLSTEVSRITTVATAGDSVMLPPSVAGLSIYVINHAANPMQVFGYGSDQIDDQAAATGVSQMPYSLVLYTCATAGNWYSEGLATGFCAPGLQTLSYQGGITAHAGGGQASAVALTAMVNQVATVATAGDSVKLPASAPGLAIVVVSSAAKAMQVFGSGTDTINGIAAATGISQIGGSVATYTCTAAGAWFTQTAGQGFSANLPAAMATDNITAHAGGGQGAAVALTAVVNRITTAANQGDSVKLPPSAPGLTIFIDNHGAKPIQVFGSGTDTINGIATATGISQGVNTVQTYFCVTAGNWEIPLAGGTPEAFTTQAASGAIPPHVSHNYVITAASAEALTLAAPTATTDDGVLIALMSNTAYAHTLTATGLLNTGSASVNTATFAAYAGAGLTLMAYQGKWIVQYANGITFS